MEIRTNFLCSPDGSFELTADPSILTAAVGEGEHTLDIDVIVPGAEGAKVTTTFADVIVDGSAVRAAVDEETEQPIVDAPVSVQVSDPLHVAEAINAVDDTQSLNACGYTLKTRYDGRQVTVGSTFSTTSVVTAKFAYTAGASSEVGVAATTTATGATWQASGSTKVSASATTTFDSVTGSHGRAYVKYQDYGKYTHTPCSGMVGQLPSQFKPIGNLYGATHKYATTPYATQCARYAANLLVDTGRAHNFSSGVSTAAVIGINLSSQSGYSSSVSISYTRPVGKSFSLCGTGARPEQFGQGQLVAKG